MEAPLSSYWVKFFKNAGFSSDVATKHALIFSNNRIKPDMLPDLDKPSLKEMGITLMGDMIAILRYAKKVVEENSCKKFLVHSEDSLPTPKPATVKPTTKKIISKSTLKAPGTPKVKQEALTKVIKTASSSILKPSMTAKKLSPITQTSRLYSDYIDTSNQRPTVTAVKRKYDSDEEDSDEKWGHKEISKRVKNSDDEVNYKVVVSKGTADKSQKILKKALEQKRTVFHRLGDSMVSSTTESTSSSFSPTFNITGLDKSIVKRNSSVFKRLGNKDNESEFNRDLRNGVSSGSQGILKTQTSFMGTKVITTRPVLKKPVGTMRADEESVKKTVSLKQRVKKKSLTDGPLKSNSLSWKVPITGRLASERIEVPAKSRLGVTKQVTFNKMATVAHIRKQGVFSRLGV